MLRDYDFAIIKNGDLDYVLRVLILYLIDFWIETLAIYMFSFSSYTEHMNAYDG